MMVVALSRYAKLAWGTLAFNLLVILWGGFVRATGSGAGCGGHWPLCNGEVVPRGPTVATMIEYSHRLSSGVALLLVAALVVGAWRGYPRGHPVRIGAALSGVFIITEAFVGAGLVLLELVAYNTSAARGYWVAGHLLNTFLLVGVLTLTAWWASGGPPMQLDQDGGPLVMLGAALIGVLILGMSGAVTALGDTLFPATNLAAAEAQTFSRTAHPFIRLRLWHPVLAVALGIYLLGVIRSVTATRPGQLTSTLAAAVIALYLLQLLLGAMNVWLLAPLTVQIAHLLLSDLVWIALVLFTVSALRSDFRGQVPVALHR
jgi:heme A synthase